jgi:hypothetical protein
MNMSDWWSKKIAGETPSPSRNFTTPPTTPALRFPMQQPSAPVQQQQQGNQNVLDPNRAPTEQIGMGDAIRMWKGGEAARKEGNMSCPECGSKNVFSRVGRGSNSMINGAQPAPRCFECGWNGKYGQADQSNWGV